MSFCTKCGSQINGGAAFCTSCGQPVSSKEQEEANSNSNIPVFTPPNNGEKTINGEKEIPSFTPPTPTFEPPNNPKPQFNGPACCYHNTEPAVTRCPRCGKPLCQDCAESYGFTSGEYAGKSLCYDCTIEIWKNDEATLNKNYAKIRSQRILCLVGVIIGAIIGLFWGLDSSGSGTAGEVFGITLIMTIACAAIGGSFLVYIKGVGSHLAGCFASTGNVVLSICIGIAKFIFWLVAYAVVALIETVRKLISYTAYMKHTANYVEQNNRAMQSLQDYMEYTLVRNQNKGVDIKTLLAEDSKLADNSFAQMVQQQGKDAAEASIRQQVAYINEFGEVVRDFAA
jgi:hypothetical protein